MILNRQNKYGMTPLMKSAYNGNIELTRALVNSGVKINIKDNTGSNALRYASQEGHTNVVKLLLENGADFNNKDKKVNSTPLHNAVLYGYKDIVELLLNAGANVNIQTTPEKHSALMFAGASKNRNNDIINMLLNAGADVNSRDKNGVLAYLYLIHPIDVIKSWGSSGKYKK